MKIEVLKAANILADEIEHTQYVVSLLNRQIKEKRTWSITFVVEECKEALPAMQRRLDRLRAEFAELGELK